MISPDTPESKHLMEKAMVANGAMSTLDFMESLTIMHRNGKSCSPVYSKEEITARREFPLLGSTMTAFMKAYNALSEANKVNVLSDAEKTLEFYVETGKYAESVVVKWFKGELFDDFFSPEENDLRFIKYLLKEAV